MAGKFGGGKVWWIIRDSLNYKPFKFALTIDYLLDDLFITDVPNAQKSKFAKHYPRQAFLLDGVHAIMSLSHHYAWNS